MVVQMGAMKNLQKDRYGTFYVRMVVPQSLRSILGRGELKRSLQTKDWREANTRAPGVLQEFNALLEAARLDASITPHDLSLTVTRWSNWVLANLDKPEIRASFLRQEWDGDVLCYADNVGELTNLLDAVAHASTEQPLKQLVAFLHTPLLAAQSLSGIRLLVDSEHYQRLALMLAKEYLKLSELVLSNLAINANLKAMGQPEITLVAPSSPPAVRHSATTKTLSVLFSDYKTALLRREPKKGPARITEYTPAIERFIALLGDKPIEAITKKDVAEFRNLLEQLPSRPKEDVAELPLRQQMVVAHETHLPLLSLATVKKLTRGLSAVLGQAVDDGLLEHNPAHGVKVSIPVATPTDDNEPAFRADELNSIFRSPLFEGRRMPKRANFGEALYWIPMMLYYSGARIEELCQLYVADIRQDNGIWFYRIAEQRTDQRVKNLSSNRDVPIHSHLIELGFLDYLSGLAAEGRVFPCLTSSGAKEVYHARLGVWWGKYLQDGLHITRAGIRRFHSFRHTFMTHCREQGIREDIQNAITGHSQHAEQTHTGRNYGVYPLAVKQEAIEKIPRLPVVKRSAA